MADASVFYSWQSDLPANLTRSFIEKCLEKACKQTGAKLSCDLAIDQDGRGEGGSPAIPDVIQRKIEGAVAFVADLSIVSRRPAGGGLTNGCVAVEWGWAEQALGSGAMVGVMNLAFGAQADLPIDIRQHLVRSVYSIGVDDGDELRSEARATLTASLERGLRDAVHKRFFFELHPAAPALVAGVVKESQHGLATNFTRIDELAEASGIAPIEVEAVVEDLERVGLARFLRGLGTRAQVSFLPRLFAKFDPLYKGWNADRDARSIAQWLVDHRSLSPEEYLKAVGWAPRRLNPALAHLITNRLVTSSSAIPGDRPFVTLQVDRNERTRAFAEGRLHVPGLFERVRPGTWG